MACRSVNAWRNTLTSPLKSYYAFGNLRAVGPGVNTGSLAVDKIYAFPLEEVVAYEYDEMDCNPSSSHASAKVRLGIYLADDAGAGDLMPKSLVLDAGEIAVTTASLKTLSINFTSDPKSLYWGVLHTGVQAVNWDGVNKGNCWPIFGWDASGNPMAGLTADQAYGALPATFPTAGLAYYSPSNIPQIRLRPSAVA